MFGFLKKRKIKKLNAKIQTAKSDWDDLLSCSGYASGRISTIKNDIANWQRQIDKLKGKK